VGVTTNGVASTLSGDGSSAPKVVTIANLCGLTNLDVQGSSKYKALTAKQTAAVDVLTTKADLITNFKATIQALTLPGWLTHRQADTIKSLAGTL
jgi:hypothetical protein